MGPALSDSISEGGRSFNHLAAAARAGAGGRAARA
jgi:hypothetical protein